jgi:hypothetical protein
MRRSRSASIAVLFVALAACKKDTGKDEARSAEAEKAAPPIEPAQPQRVVTATRAALERAYLADCNHVNVIELEDMEGEKKGDECVLREFDQNCAPDIFGCWNKNQACRDACAKPCSDCQAACTTACGGCKSACAGKPDADPCKQACAVKRADCREKCVARLTQCRENDCSKVEDDCQKEGIARRDKECGKDCAAFEGCIEKVLGGEGDEKGCIAKFPSFSQKCREWCSPSD